MKKYRGVVLGWSDGRQVRSDHTAFDRSPDHEPDTPTPRCHGPMLMASAASENRSTSPRLPPSRRQETEGRLAESSTYIYSTDEWGGFAVQTAAMVVQEMGSYKQRRLRSRSGWLAPTYKNALIPACRQGAAIVQ